MEKKLRNGTEDPNVALVRDHVFKEKKKKFNVRMVPMSCEEFIRYVVYGQEPPPHLRAEPDEPELKGVIRTMSPEASVVDRQKGTGSIPQAGPNHLRDLTPDIASPYEKRLYRSPRGVTYGSMELFRDAEGRTVRRVLSFGGQVAIRTFAYDAVGRLVAVHEGGQCVEAYEYGPNGERLTDGNGARYRYDSQLRLVQKYDSFGSTEYLYDVHGRLVQCNTPQGAMHMGYNVFGALTDVVLPDGKHIHYVLDPVGRRIAKSVDGVVVEKYAWLDMVRLFGVCDGNDENGIQLLYEEDMQDLAEEARMGGSSVGMRSCFGPPRSMNRQQPAHLPVAFRYKGELYSLAYDQAGSLLGIADASGNVIQKNEHDSFGNVLHLLGGLGSHTHPVFFPIGFAGGLEDRDTGLTHFVFRDYDPEIGRFIQPDPLGYSGGDVDVYGYCLDDPINLIDPLGLKAESGDSGKKAAPSADSEKGDAPSQDKEQNPAPEVPDANAAGADGKARDQDRPKVELEVSTWNPLRFWTDEKFRKEAVKQVGEEANELGAGMLKLVNNPALSYRHPKQTALEEVVIPAMKGEKLFPTPRRWYRNVSSMFE